MRSSVGVVCSDRPVGRILSSLHSSSTQTVSTVCFRGAGILVHGTSIQASVSLHLQVVEALLVPLRQHRVHNLNYLARLGLRVNWENSKLSPVQRITFLGMEIDSVAMYAQLTSERV